MVFHEDNRQSVFKFEGFGFGALPGAGAFLRTSPVGNGIFGDLLADTGVGDGPGFVLLVLSAAFGEHAAKSRDMLMMERSIFFIENQY